MYSKHKDAEPKDTINRIKTIFDQIDISLTYQSEEHVEGLFTSHLTDPTSLWHTEGKGTTSDFCEASAYGEAMEHICTHYAFDISTVSEYAKNYRGFFRYPDEMLGLVSDILDVSPIIIDEMKEPYIRLKRPVPSNKELITLWEKILKSSTTPFTPYYHVNSEEIVFLPDAVLSKLCGTNGGGCGNTPEEAIGHALDEIVERWCKYIIFSDKMTPPQIPDDYLAKRCPDLLSVKQIVESQGQFEVLVLDASLGKGFPVACVALIDPESSRYLVNFGCHPQFEIALERCFTEIFQDRRIVPELIERKDMSVWPNFDETLILSQRNWAKLLEDDLGIWPNEFFGNCPSWSFQEWPVYDSYSNKIGMNSQLIRLKNIGAEIYIRNVSFLGFPVYKVYIKGISTSHINYTEDILNDLNVLEKMNSFINGELSKQDMLAISKTVFGMDSIFGRMYFNSLSNEQFELLHAAFLMEYEDSQNAFEVLRYWNSREATVVKQILELKNITSLENAVGSAKRVTSCSIHGFIDAFFSKRPFHNLLEYYKFYESIKRNISGNAIQHGRSVLLTSVKDYMAEHMVSQNEIRDVI